MSTSLSPRYELGVADLEGPPGGFILRKIVGHSRLLGKTGAPPWVILPAAVVRFRNRQSGRSEMKAPAFDALTGVELSGLRMVELLLEQGRQADMVFVRHDTALWKKRTGNKHVKSTPTFELAIMFAAAVPAVGLFRQLDGSVVSVNKGKQRSACPIALGAEILQFHQEIWPDVPLPG
jgi:hypothetical protein